MSFWGLVLVHAVPSGILARSAAPHSWTHSDTMLHDGMDRGYTEAADTTSFDISTIWEHEVQFLFIKTLKTKSSAAGLHKLWYPGIRDTSTWSKFGAHGEHGDVFLFSNLGAL